MVFILRHVTTGITAVLGENKEYTLGRSRQNSILLRDASCQMKHAKIMVKKHKIYNFNTVSLSSKEATIKVLSPKGAVFVDGHQIHNETVLEPGNAIIFGDNSCCFSFIDPKFEVYIDDTVMGNNREDLCKVLKKLNVNVANQYSNKCTHFVISTLTLDKIKNSNVLVHFLNKKTIVRPEFWVSMYKNIDEAAEIPNIYRYMPILEQPFIDHGVEMVKCRTKTRNLFKDIPCVFFNETLETALKYTIIKCGGLTFLHDGKVTFVNTLSKMMNFNTAIVVTAKEPDEPPITITHFVKKMRENNKKVYELDQDDIYISVLKGKLNVVENNNESLDVIQINESDEPNENLNSVFELNDDLPVESTINGKDKLTSKGWVTPKKTKRIAETEVDKNREKPSTSRKISYDDEINESNVPNKGIKRKGKQKIAGSTIETEEKLDTSLDMSDTDSDDLCLPNKRIEEVQKQAKENALKRTKKDFKSLSMSSSDSDSSLNGDGCNKSSELPKLPMKNTVNRQNGEKHLKNKSDDKSAQKGRSKRLKINPLAKLKKLKENNEKESSLNISYLNKLYQDVEFEPFE